MRLETIGAVATLLASVLAVEQREGASNAGLLLNYAMQMSILMAITLRVGSVVENNVSGPRSSSQACPSLLWPTMEGLSLSHK